MDYSLKSFKVQTLFKEQFLGNPTAIWDTKMRHYRNLKSLMTIAEKKLVSHSLTSRKINMILHTKGLFKSAPIT